jgi:hypothetical protein
MEEKLCRSRLAHREYSPSSVSRLHLKDSAQQGVGGKMLMGTGVPSRARPSGFETRPVAIQCFRLLVAQNMQDLMLRVIRLGQQRSVRTARLE